MSELHELSGSSPPGGGAPSFEPAADKIATAEDYAAVDFKGWTNDDNDWIPGNYGRDDNPHGVSVRSAWALLRMDKAELVEAMRGLDEELQKTLYEMIESALEYFKYHVTFLESANIRLLSALSTLEVEQQATETAAGAA